MFAEARLVVEQPGKEARMVVLGAGQRLLIGRSSSLRRLRLDDPSVSREHAVLFFDGAAVRIEDLGSTNGCAVNDQPIESTQALSSIGDRVHLGGVCLGVVQIVVAEARSATRSGRASDPLARG